MPVISLFDVSGNAVRDWAIHGHICYCFDIEQTERVEEYKDSGKIIYLKSDLNDNSELAYIVYKLNPYFLMGFPDCTDLSVCGAKHFQGKLLDNLNFQEEAVELCRVVELIGDLCECPWMLENPISMLATLWRKPDHYFDPNEYGGYLPPDDEHPTWPEYIPPRDAYPKRTGIWCGNDFMMPAKAEVPLIDYHHKLGKKSANSIAFLKLGGKSRKTKMIRAETPRGFARATYIANRQLATDVQNNRKQMGKFLKKGKKGQ